MARNADPLEDGKGIDIFETVDKLAAGVRALEEWYAADFRQRVVGLTEALQDEVAGVLRNEFDLGLQRAIESIRAEYEERLKVHVSQWNVDRGSFKQEIDEIKLHAPSNEVLEEIARAETEIQRCAAEIERSLSDDAVALGRLLQLRTEELRLKAYLKGLQYCVGRTEESLTGTRAAASDRRSSGADAASQTL